MIYLYLSFEVYTILYIYLSLLFTYLSMYLFMHVLIYVCTYLCMYLFMQDNLEMKKRFVRYISHEIRTPLNTIGIGLQLAKEQTKKGESVEELIRLLDDVKLSNDIAVGILDGLLLYDKLDSNMLVVEKQKVSLTSLISDSVSAAQVQVSS